MYTEEQLSNLEQEERTITDEAIAVMLLLLGDVLVNLENELRNFYQLYGKDGVITYTEARKWVSNADHRRRLTTLIIYVNEHLDELRDGITPIFKDMLESVIAKESEFFKEPVEAEIADEPWGADDKNWFERLDDDITLWCAYILVDIKRGISKGVTLDDSLNKLTKRFDMIETVLKTLALSESTAVSSMTRREIFKSLGINKYQFYTRADERTCKTCGSMHGVIFPMSAYEVGVTASPLHPRCRCWEVPIMD